MIHVSCTVKAGESSVKHHPDIVVIAQLIGTWGISFGAEAGWSADGKAEQAPRKGCLILEE
ncbi:hypothetical protein GCM10027022_09920 [Alpinimonas psychrophila]|uniref:Uncharacterized protein n=1 Tax=Alpinimonas psychrophila TaxID=748908 RepID=A0A7W3JTD7_9MICO|nr:hypothetical protein [Alpinimonas psychrophila]